METYAYNYHPATGEYLGASVADESPREPGVFILPGYATWTPPPEPEDGFIIRFVDGAWGYSPLTDPESPPTEEPEPVDPLTLPMDRLTFWLVAASAGVSKWSVRDRIAAMPEETPEDKIAKYEAIAWFEEAKVYRRYDPILMTFSEAEGITPEQLDVLWAWGIPQMET